jgi:hypothetical protein
MKNLKSNYPSRRRPCILLPILLFLILTAGCQSGQDQVVPQIDEVAFESNDLSDHAARKASGKLAEMIERLENGEVLQMSGTLNYHTYALKTKEVLQDNTNDCDALLELVGKNEVVLTVKEYNPHDPSQFRMTVLIGKMTNGGQIKIEYPAPLWPGGLYITDLIHWGTGCTLTGPGIREGTLVHHGYFDGEKLNAVAMFMSKCEVYWENDLFDTPVDGPVKWKRTFNFTVD